MNLFPCFPAVFQVVLSNFADFEIPASYTFNAPDGGSYSVFNFEGTVSHESSYRNYCFGGRIRKFLSDLNIELPAVLNGKNPDIYIQGNDSADGRAIGIWNCSPDYAKNLTIDINGNFKSVESAGIKGKLEGGKIVIENLEAYRFGFINLKRENLQFFLNFCLYCNGLYLGKRKNFSDKSFPLPLSQISYYWW